MLRCNKNERNFFVSSTYHRTSYEGRSGVEKMKTRENELEKNPREYTYDIRI